MSNFENETDILNATVASKLEHTYAGIGYERTLLAGDDGQVKEIKYKVGHADNLTPSEALDALDRPGIKVQK